MNKFLICAYGLSATTIQWKLSLFGGTNLAEHVGSMKDAGLFYVETDLSRAQVNQISGIYIVNAADLVSFATKPVDE